MHSVSDLPSPRASTSTSTSKPLPVLIIGAGLSGLLLAQHLQREDIPFRIFERDSDLTSRGAGWGLTLHWSLPALRRLLPPALAGRICDEASVDREADRRGEVSRFPFFNYRTGELMSQTPGATGAQRVRVTRERLKRLMAEGVAVEWNKTFQEFSTHDDNTNNTVTALFEDGTSATGCLLVACDGGQSRVRRALFPQETQRWMQLLPVRTMGVKIDLTAEQIEPIRKLDRFFLQGASPEDNTFMYLSVLDGPGNQKDSPPDTFSCQLHVSWPYRRRRRHHSASATPGSGGVGGGSGDDDDVELVDVPPTNLERCDRFRSIAQHWAEPFRSLVLDNIQPETEIKRLDVLDWPPPKGLRSTGQVVLMGDAFHLMAMYRGEGANHAIVDVLDFAELIVPLLGRATGSAPKHNVVGSSSAASPSACNAATVGPGTVDGSGSGSGGDGRPEASLSKSAASVPTAAAAAAEEDAHAPNTAASQEATSTLLLLRQALDLYEDAVIARARPGVLASRRACLDAHNWTSLFGGSASAGPSPLLSKREMKLAFDDESTHLLG